MLRVTRWSPDTCSCVLEYEWDDAQDENIRTHSFKRAVQLCEHHKALVASEAYDQVISENTRKNMEFEVIKTTKPDASTENYVWWFDNKRVLQVSILKPELDTLTKDKVQVDSDKVFGIGKVKVI